MTTLIQSELDDLLRESTKFGASAFCRLKAVEKLRDHIAQLTAERDEAIADNDDCHIEIAGKDARIAALEAQLAEAVAALEPFAKEESTWANSVADDYRPGLVEPNQRTAYSKAEFSIGDLRRAAAIRTRSKQALCATEESLAERKQS